MSATRLVGLLAALGLGALLFAVTPVGSTARAEAPNALPLQVFAYDLHAPLALESQALETREGVVVQAISFDSPKGGRVTGRLFVPGGKGPYAGVVLAHGAPGNAQGFTGRAVYIAKHGAVVVVIDAPFNRRDGGPWTFTNRDRDEQVELIVDLQRAVDVLLARPDVAPARLAYVGRSYGGATGALFVGVERRLKSSILASADGGITTRYTGANAAHPPIPDTQMQAWLAAMDPIEGYRFVGNANGPILFQNGRRDVVVTPERAEALHAKATGRKEVRWYDAEHQLNAEAYVDQLRWLATTVGTAPPRPEDAAGPEIPPPAPARR
jgi:dienelactone hydrolase